MLQARGHPTGAAALASIERLSREEREDISERLAVLAGPDPPDAGLRKKAVRELADAGCDVGFHTLNHDRLVDLGDADLRAALTDGRDSLADAAGRTIEMISYPHGAANIRVAEAVTQAGYRVGFTVTSEAVREPIDHRLVPRIAPSARSAGHVAVQLSLALLARSKRYKPSNVNPF
jgi:hypothetical protein